jgi:hypothetical protein
VRASPYRGSKADRGRGRAAAYSTTAGLLGAHIGRQLNFDGANLTNPDGHALQMQELQVRSHPWGVGLSEAESRRLTARRLDGRAGITGVVSRFLGDLARHADHLAGAQSERVLADLTDRASLPAGSTAVGGGGAPAAGDGSSASKAARSRCRSLSCPAGQLEGVRRPGRQPGGCRQRSPPQS